MKTFSQLGGNLLSLSLNDETGMFPHYNPSIIRWQGEQLFLVRCCNYTYPTNALKPILTHLNNPTTHNVVLASKSGSEWLTEPTGRPQRLAFQGLPAQTLSYGVEDCRWTALNGELMLTGVIHANPQEPTLPSIGLFSFERATMTAAFIKELPSPISPKQPEKNWTPVEGLSLLSYSPTQTLDPLDGRLSGEKYVGQLHNTSPLVKLPEGGFISLLHAIKKDTGKQYIHYFGLYNSSAELVGLSEGFKFFAEERVEFASSLFLDEANLCIGLGAGDRFLAVGSIPLETVKTLIRPYSQQNEEELIGPSDLSAIKPVIEVRIVTHPARLKSAEKIQRFMKTEGFQTVELVVDEEGKGATLNHFAACSKTPLTETTHLIILEDDVIPVRGFKKKAEKAIRDNSKSLIAIYLGRGRPVNIQARIPKLLESAPNRTTFALPNLLSGQGYILPAFMAETYTTATPWDVEFADLSVGRVWKRRTAAPILYLKRSLIEHSEAPSLHTPNRPEPQPRVAWQLDGEPAWKASQKFNGNVRDIATRSEKVNTK